MAKTALLQATPQQELALGVGATKCLNKFDDYLLRVKGVAPGQRKTYGFWVPRFLAGFCGSGCRLALRIRSCMMLII